MKALLVDDDMYFCDFFREKLLHICSELGLDIACDISDNTGQKFQSWTEYDIYFLDIEMPQINGLRLAEEIRDKNQSSEIFFVSFYENYVFEAFGVKAGGFIRKKRLTEDLYKVLLSLAKYGIKRQSFVEIPLSNEEMLTVKPTEIFYCQSEEHYVKFFKEEQCSTLHRVRLDVVENVLEEFSFLRVHERYLVNREYIKALKADKLQMKNDMEIPISRSYRKKVRDILFERKVL